MSEILILYILSKYEASIYKIAKLIEELFFAFLKPSLGTINPAIKKLEKLGAIEINHKMSEGGMEKKTCSITPFGKKHLVDLLLGFEFSNPSNVINNIKMAIFCSNVLEEDEKNEFKKNIENHLQLFIAKTQNKAQNPYISLNQDQEKLVQITINEAKALLEVL